MASDVFCRANAEFVNENYENAVELYTKAIDMDGEKDEFYCSRAHAYLKLENYQDAAADADKALNINNASSKAYLRKGIALFHLKDYEKANKVLMDGQNSYSSDNNIKTWIAKCQAELDLLKRKEASSEENAIENSTAEKQTEEVHSVDQQTTAINSDMKETPPVNTAVKPLPMPLKKTHDWYQTATHVLVTVLQKNVRSEDLTMDIQENSVSVTIKQASGSDFSLELDLAHLVIPEQSSYKIMSTKIEIKLKKTEGIQWTKLEGDGQQNSNVKPIPMSFAETSVAKYPSSSHHTRNWDKLAQEVTEEEKNEKSEGDAALNQLFQKIYADANDDTKKAMAKSFYESGGTVLSTNWSEIGSQKTEIKSPDGMEFKKWNS